jgi:PAS domain S-box-containing protein
LSILLSEDQFRSAVQLVEGSAVFLLDARGVVRTWNAGAERIKGHRAGEIVGQHFGRLYTPEDVATSKPDRVLLAAAQQGLYQEQGWRQRRDGRRFWAGVGITTLRDEQQLLVGFAKVTRDLGAAPPGARSDEGSDALTGVLEHLREATLLSDARGIVSAANPAAEALLRVARGFFVRRPLINVVARQDTRRFRALVMELQDAPVGTVRVETLRLRPRGHPVFLATLRVARVGDARGVALYWTLGACPTAA